VLSDLIIVALRSRLSAQHTFDFIDAECFCPAAPGIAGLYPPPYLCWYEHGTPDDVQAAHDYLVSVIDEDGPYDGVIGFSEGAALAASLLLWDEFLTPSHKPRFKVAILLNSVIPLVPSSSLGQTLNEIVTGDQDSYLDLLVPGDREPSAEDQKQPLSQAFCFPVKGSAIISIPTLHIIGTSDPFVESSRVLVDLCQPELAQVLLHEGGHELPQAGMTLDKCAELVEMAILLASIR
jgi:Serine hydrolase (FSH1)